MAILDVLLSVLITAVLVRVVGLLVPGLRVNDWLAALMVGLFAVVAGWLLGPVLRTLPLPPSVWIGYASAAVVNTLLLGLAGLVSSDVHIRGVVPLVAGGVLLTVLDTLAGQALAAGLASLP